MNREQLKGHLDVLLLAVVDVAPSHGYAIISALRDQSEGAFDLPEGTVYPALHRLEAAGLIRSRWGEVGGRRRRVYELTGAGSGALAERRQEWSEFAVGIDNVLRWAPA